MIGIAMFMTIITLWQKGESQRKIARSVGCSRDAVRYAIAKFKKYGFESPIKNNPGSIMDAYKLQVIEYLEKGLSAIRIYEELQNAGAHASYSTVSHYVYKIKAKDKICVRFHTLPGEEAQVDFGYVGLHFNREGERKKAWVFNMRLSYSRLDYYEIVFDQTVKTFIQAHTNAFRYYGGVPKVVKIDNLKAAILEASFYEDTYQQLYKKFCDHYGCSPIPCRVREPQEKGKVEAGIKFVKNNFFAGRKFSNYQELTASLKKWLDKQTQRVHGTTKKVPREIFTNEEKTKLICLPLADFIIPEIIRRKVYNDCHITIDSNYYSVPYEYVGKIVDVQRDNKLLHIYYQNKQIALHNINLGKGEFITNASHYPKYKHFTPESPAYRALYNEKMKAVGKYAGAIFDLLLKLQPYNWYKTAKGILSLQKLYSNNVIELACQRALSFEIVSFSKIKNICKTGSYNLPLDNLLLDNLPPNNFNNSNNSNSSLGGMNEQH
jgi:transposase